MRLKKTNLTPDDEIRQIRDGQSLILRHLVPETDRKGCFTGPITQRPARKGHVEEKNRSEDS
jgi:hypothetical protein